MKVYVLYFRNTYVDINGTTDPDETVGVFSSVEKIAEYMRSNDWLCRYLLKGEEWIRVSQADYPHDEIYYYKSFELDVVEK